MTRLEEIEKELSSLLRGHPNCVGGYSPDRRLGCRCDQLDVEHTLSLTTKQVRLLQQSLTRTIPKPLEAMRFTATPVKPLVVHYVPREPAGANCPEYAAGHRFTAQPPDVTCALCRADFSLDGVGVEGQQGAAP